jgi:Carboxypeptidase regulatory-like domain
VAIPRRQGYNSIQVGGEVKETQHTRSKCRQASYLAAAFLLLSGAACAQSTYGTITGAVTDPSSAVIVGAKVEAKNESTGDVRTVQTNPEGFFRFVNLDPGTYNVSAGASGFDQTERKGVALLAREEVRVDLQLPVTGGAHTTVEVVGTPVVTEALTLSDSKSGDAIDSLALNFRATGSPSPIGVADLAPQVTSDKGGNLTIAGQLSTATAFSVDGVSTQLPRQGGPTRDLFPSVEGIAEFKVNSAGNSAEYSQPSDVTAISRSGTNDFHGGGFWYLQRKDFNSPDQISGVIPTGDANTFGGSLGGPIWKNHTFFYFDYEGVRLDQNTIINTTTPPSQWRTGDFSQAGSVIINPLTQAPFPGNMIPSYMINSVSAKILPLFFPNPTNSTPTLNGNNFVDAFPGTYSNDGFDGRLDHAFSDKHRVWGRITQKNITSVGTDQTGSPGDTYYNPLMGAFTTGEDLWNLATSYDWIIKPSLVNEFRVGFSRADFTFGYPQAKQGDSIISSLGIGGLPGSPKNGLGGVPVFYIGDFLGGATNEYGHPRDQKNGVLEIGDNLSWIKGSHSFKFGGEFRRVDYEDNITFLNGDEYGDYDFTGLFTSIPGRTNSDVNGFADFLLGFVSGAEQAQNGPDGKPFGYHYGGFATDEWRLRPNFTITIGLRYEVNTPFDDATHQLGNFDRNFPGGRLVVQNNEAPISPAWKTEVGDTPFVTASQVGLPNTLRFTYFGNIQPRLGLAWSPGNNNKTVIRASGGIYSVPVMGAVLYSLLGVDTSNFADYTSTATNPLIFPNIFAGSGSVGSYPGYRRANEYHLKDPRVEQWNFSIDHDLGWNTLARASYTGSHTYNLIYSPNLNQIAPNNIGYAALTATPALRAENLKYPNFSEVLTRDNGPSDKYEAMTLELNKRFGGGLTFANNYTLTWNKTNALGVAPTSSVPLGGQVDNGDNVNNYYDIASDTGNAYYSPRHRFVSTFVYDLPVGRGKKYFSTVSHGANLVVGGWGVTGVTLLQSGFWLTPYFPSSLSDPSGTNPSQRSVSTQRPDCVAGTSATVANPTITDYFNVAAFTIPASNIGRFGNCGVGILQGPGTATFSMSAGKTFQVTERIGVRYEAQFANLFNILNKDVPNMNVASGGFGQITSSQLTSQAGPRTIQMMLRVQF